MALIVSISQQKPAVGAALAAEFLKISGSAVNWSFGADNSLSANKDAVFTSSASIGRFLARSFPASNLQGETILEKTEVDHWINFAYGQLSCASDFATAIEYLDYVLKPATYLVGNALTLADFAVWEVLQGSSQWQRALQKSAPQNVDRYYKFLCTQAPFSSVLPNLPQVEVKDTKKGDAPVKKEEGKFVELPGAEIGKVVTRFPPEASGYLHIGHAKAALLNAYYRDIFKGTLIMRFDDTNPAKENAEFEKVILEDVAMMGIKYDKYSHTSDHFDTLLAKCEQLMREGKVYCDDTDPVTMKEERDERKESKNRNNSVEKNLLIWEEMKKGSAMGQKYCLRAKIDMTSNIGCMRDPVFYRCKPEVHVRTGAKYKVYPTYDFACPIVDSIEGVTHALRTTEYHDRDVQYFWVLDHLNMRKPYIYEYSRLNLQNTVLSKRKLTWFVSEGLVDGWDDPRFPTVRGVLRRGMTVEGLKQFIVTQGSSRSVVMMEWDKIWAVNRKVIDPVVPRFTALLKEEVVPVNVAAAKVQSKDLPKHPKNEDAGLKKVWYGPKVYIEGADATCIKEGEVVTFINWGNIIIKKINKDAAGKVTSVNAELNLDNTDYKKTQKITWLTDVESAIDSSQGALVPTVCVQYEHIITKGVLDKDEDFKQYINTDSKKEQEMVGDPCLASLKKGEIIQLQRRGYFICDQPYQPASPYTGRASPCVLFSVPDGHQKEMPTAGSKHKEEGGKKTVSAKEKAQSKKGKAAEKSPQDEQPPQQVGSAAVNDLDNQIRAQGEQVRQLKTNKAPKEEVTAAVQTLLSLKKQYKETTGKDWTPPTPGSAPAQTPPTASAGGDLDAKIKEQGDKVRQVKANKAPKAEVDAAVQTLLSLKKQYKEATGSDWKPGAAAPASAPAKMSAPSSAGGDLDAKITEQGDKVRQMKANKAPKAEVDAAVQTLLSLKKQYKEATGSDWKPGAAPASAPAKSPAPSAAGGDLDAKIKEQGDKVRQVKADKAPKAEVDTQVQALLGLKKQYKEATGRDWTPPKAGSPEKKAGGAEPKAMPVAGGKVAADSSEALAVKAEVDTQGEKVRQLKTGGGAKDEVDAAVKKLLELKIKYKDVTGVDLAGGGKREKKSGGGGGGGAAAAGGDKNKGGGKQKGAGGDADKGKKDADASREVKKVTRLGLEAKKEENLADWYSQVITKSELIEYYDVSGCYILRPWSYSIWERIKDFFDAEIKKMGVENCYFPIFVSQSALEKEKTHIEDFAPEVAWVTRSGQSELAEPIAIRPTSETVMYPSYAKWIKSHRDLPLRLNQWCNVVRWEFKHPQPFLRTREFLWQEGHTAWADKKPAEEEVYAILELYAQVYEDLLAIPVVRGRKTEKEKFAGGDFTTTVEAYISASGRAIQGGTSHHLGQNFSKMFEIVFEDPETQQKQYVYQNSWGLTTRTIGVMTMVHGDNIGLVLPPRVACVQVVVVPCGVTTSLSEADTKALYSRCDELASELNAKGVRARSDVRDNYSPGWKFNHWELKGVPVRLELGPRDIKAKQVVLVRRDNGERSTVPDADVPAQLTKLLDTIQQCLYNKAEAELKSSLAVSHDWNEFCDALDKSKLIQAPFCGEIPCEDAIKKDSARDVVVEEGAPAMGAKGLCIPFKQPAQLSPGTKCIHPSCGKPAKYYTLFGRSY
ncbi:hypothetical protein V1264_019176 [Littorina saxatilis]|uniref:Bifunctional glutamate/proline--tRNA ligase n=1 Tax=Littorina saxatilis TaxID=31220 RepID=A0AAN9GCZ4_9CAEN